MKDTIKKIFGRHYQPWIQRPYAALHPQHLIAVAGRHLHLGGAFCRRKPVWHPLRWLASPLEAVARASEHNYRCYYHRFGVAAAALPHDRENRREVLLVSGSLSSGGSERQVVLTTMGLAHRGLPVQLAVVYLRTEAERFYLHKLETAGMPVLEFDRDTSRDDARGLREVLRAVSTLPSVLRDVADYARTLAVQYPAAVHLWLDEVNIKGGLAAVAAGVPHIILSGRNLPPNHYLLYQPYMREGYRWLLQQPGITLINNSRAGARAYERWLGLRKGSIRVVYNGFDFDDELLECCRRQRAAYREHHGIPQTSLLVGTVMRLNEEKRPLLWAEIAARIGRELPEAHFLVVGNGPLRKPLEAQAAQADLAGRLHVVGVEKQALDAMAAMDLFLLSSRGEGLPNVLVEAQALGVPVVTTRVGGAPEALDHGRTGWVLGSDKPERAAAEIVRLLSDPSWLREAGRAGPEFVKSRFGFERMLDETLEVYGDRAGQLAVDGGNVVSEGIGS